MKEILGWVSAILIGYGLSKIDLVIVGVLPLKALLPFVWAIPLLITYLILYKKETQ